jgi:hypothetical protein
MIERSGVVDSALRGARSLVPRLSPRGPGMLEMAIVAEEFRRQEGSLPPSPMAARWALQGEIFAPRSRVLGHTSHHTQGYVCRRR